MYRFPNNEGIQAGVRIWIAFLLIFWFLRLRAELCILLGAIAGVAAGYLVSYWNAQKLPNSPVAKPPEPSNNALRQVGNIVGRFRQPGEGQGLPTLRQKKPRKRLGK